MPSASASVDAEFMGQVIEMVDLAYRDFGSRPSSRELGQVAARIYAKAISVGADPAERVGALKVLVSDAREELLRKMNKMDEQHGR